MNSSKIIPSSLRIGLRSPRTKTFIRGNVAAFLSSVSQIQICNCSRGIAISQGNVRLLKLFFKITEANVKIPTNTCNCLIEAATAHQSTRICSSTSISKKTQQRQTIVQRSVERMAAARSVDSHKEPMLQNFHYFLVLDFEATCDNERRISPQEIIEFPVLKVNAKTLAVDSTFHQYVRPLFNPHLTPFCTELTGIVQDMVDNQKCFPEVMKDFNQWMEAEGLLNPDIQSIFVTCGDWDLKSMLPRQCETSRLHSASYFNRWINIKKSYADVTGTFPKGMMPMLTGLRLQHVGRHHSGIDDCRNIANVVVELMKQGYVFRENGRLR